MKDIKAQIHSALIYIFSSIVFLIILMFGYNSIFKFKETEESVSYIRFKEGLQNDIKSISSDYGSVKKLSYRVSNDVEEICLYDKSNFELVCREQCQRVDEHKIASIFIEDSQDKNLFLIGENTLKGSDYIKGISIECCKFICFENQNGKVNIKIEGLGDKALIKNLE